MSIFCPWNSFRMFKCFTFILLYFHTLNNNTIHLFISSYVFLFFRLFYLCVCICSFYHTASEYVILTHSFDWIQYKIKMYIKFILMILFFVTFCFKGIKIVCISILFMLWSSILLHLMCSFKSVYFYVPFMDMAQVYWFDYYIGFINFS